jgi:hypothetical protein
MILDNIPKKYKYGAVVVITISSFAVGRYTVPEKIKIETKVVEVEKKISDVDQNKNEHKKVVVVEVKQPNGTDTITTTTQDDVKTDVKTDTKVTDDTTTDTTKTVTKSNANLNLSVMGGINILNPSQLLIGGSVTKQIIGPFTLGIWGLSNATAGVSIGVNL